MAIVDLTGLKCSAGDPSLLTWAVLHEPALGGVTQRIGRLGDRFRIDFSTPAMAYEPRGRRTVALLQRALREGGRVRYIQPGFGVGSPGSPTVDGSHTGGMTLAITGATPRYAVREGQALNLTVAGRVYLYFAAAAALLDGAGDGELTLTTPMRTHLAGAEAVDLAKPMIEGWLSGNQLDWKPGTDGNLAPIEFTISERA